MATEFLPLVTPLKQQKHPPETPKFFNAYPKNPNCEPRSVPPLQFSTTDLPIQHLCLLLGFFLTCLDHPDLTNLNWIQCTCLHIYTLLDEVKNDPSHPFWSVVNTWFMCKYPCWITVILYTWENFLCCIFIPVKKLISDKLKV